MTKAMEWLKAKAPGFIHLSEDEQNAIGDFSLLWSLFESRILNSRGNADAICHVIDTWTQQGGIDAALFSEELAYFQNRYYANAAFTDHFGQLNFRNGDHEEMVRNVLSAADVDTGHKFSTALIIVYRYRNNLFHGLKWQDGLAGQVDNFNAANAILMKTLDRHGELS
jgi:hypothetical protein